MLHGLRLSFALLATWLVAGTPALTLGYDADGLRVSKQVGGGTPTRYLVDTLNPTGYAQVLAEYSGDGTSRQLVRAYAYGLDLLSQRTQGSGLVEFFSADAPGSTRFLTRFGPTPGAGGGINGSLGELTTQTFSYDAYGLLATGSAAATAYLYTGEQWDADVGAYYLRARWHLPEWGRFLSRDTYEGTPDDPLSQNRFLYCHANPVNGTDPSGHEFTFTGTLTSLTTAEGMQGMKGGVEAKVKWEIRDMVKQMGNDLLPTDLNQKLGYEAEKVWTRHLNKIPGFRAIRAKGPVSAVGPDIFGMAVKNGKITLFIGEVKASESRQPGLGRLKWSTINNMRQMSANWLDEYASQALRGMIDLGLQGLVDVDDFSRYVNQGMVEAYLLGALKEAGGWRIRGFRLMHLGGDEVIPDITEGGFPQITNEQTVP